MTVPESFIGQIIFLLTNFSELFIEGIKITLIIALLGTLFGTIIGSILAIVRGLEASSNANILVRILFKILRGFVTVYIDVVRGTPMMVQAIIVYYGFASKVLDPVATGVLIVSFNSAAYIAEIIRSGINSTPKGQMEAARSLGLNHVQAMKKVILPQALKNSVPALMNELIVNVKDSSVLSVIGVTELFYMSKAAGSEFYLTLPSYVIAAGIYLIITMSLTKLFEYILSRDGNKNVKKISMPTAQTVPEEMR
jgi:putative lysine transport system permease protein